MSYVEVRGAVVFDHVTFSYDGKKTVLNDVSLYAKPGQKIAFVGSTGAGKTTITNLINRFYDVPGGGITYDGIPIERIHKGDLRRSMSMVLQDTHLFTGTVMENIRYGKLDATDEEVVKAASLANADSFIRHLPHGYDTVLQSDGDNLSQGQRQSCWPSPVPPSPTRPCWCLTRPPRPSTPVPRRSSSAVWTP